MLSLRHFDKSDAAILLESQYINMSIEKIQDMICDWNQLEFHGKYFEMFAIVNDDNDKIVGMISLFQHSERVISIGPEIFPAFQRQGFAKEAMRIALDIAKRKEYKIVTQQVRRNNIPSIALHKSLGFETDSYGYINRNGNEVFIFLKALL